MKDIHCDRCFAKFKRAKQIIYNFCVDSLKELNLIIQQVFLKKKSITGLLKDFGLFTL